MKLTAFSILGLALSFYCLNAKASPVCGQIETIETQYTPAQFLPADTNGFNQGYSPVQTYLPAVAKVKITLVGSAGSLTVGPGDVRLTLALSALSSKLTFCFDEAKNTASVRRND